jgi:hypothetical protein
LLLDLDDRASQAALARLHADVGAHVSARLPWLQAWRESHPDWRPWVLVLLDESCELRAAAPLAQRRHTGLVQIRDIGHTGLDECPVVCRTESDALDLAHELGRALRGQHRPWNLHLRQLPYGSAFAAALAHELDVVELRPGAGRPVILLDSAPRARAVLSRNQRKAEAKARNRIRRAGLAFESRWITNPHAIAERVPEIRSLHHARDLQLRGTSTLDDPEEGAFYDALVRRHLDLLDLLEIRLGGALGAYVLWVRNGSTRLVLDNRVAPGWTTYSAGMIANNAAVRTAADDPRVDVVDWGAGVQRYKLQSANKVISHEQLLAWSSRSTRRVLDTRRMMAGGRRPA